MRAFTIRHLVPIMDTLFQQTFEPLKADTLKSATNSTMVKSMETFSQDKGKNKDFRSVKWTPLQTSFQQRLIELWHLYHQRMIKCCWKVFITATIYHPYLVYSGTYQRHSYHLRSRCHMYKIRQTDCTPHAHSRTVSYNCHPRSLYRKLENDQNKIHISMSDFFHFANYRRHMSLKNWPWHQFH